MSYYFHYLSTVYFSVKLLNFISENNFYFKTFYGKFNAVYCKPILNICFLELVVETGSNLWL